MSMLPLGFFASIAISMTSASIRVQDVVYQKTNGVDKQAGITSRSIDASVDPSNSRRLEKIFGGSVSDGSIGIFTSHELFFVDTTPTNKNQKQSFISYGGYQYRVTTVADWTQQAGVFVYLAERHITQDRV